MIHIMDQFVMATETSDRQLYHTDITESWLETSRRCHVFTSTLQSMEFEFSVLVSFLSSFHWGSSDAVSQSSFVSTQLGCFSVRTLPQPHICNKCPPISCLARLGHPQDKRGCCHRNLRVLSNRKVVHRNKSTKSASLIRLGFSIFRFALPSSPL